MDTALDLLANEGALDLTVPMVGNLLQLPNGCKISKIHNFKSVYLPL